MDVTLRGAIQRDDVKTVRQFDRSDLLKLPKSAILTHNTNNYPLMYACSIGSVKVVDFLLTLANDVNVTSGALYVSSKYGSLNVVRLILNKYEHHLEDLAAEIAVDEDHPEVLKVLYEYCQDKKCNLDWRLLQLLHNAIRSRSVISAKYIMERIDLHDVPPYYLDNCVEYGFTDVLKVLLDAGLDVRGDGNDMPLIKSIGNHQLDATKLLLEYYPETEHMKCHVEKDGFSASYTVHYAPALNLLIDQHIDITAIILEGYWSNQCDEHERYIQAHEDYALRQWEIRKGMNDLDLSDQAYDLIYDEIISKYR